MTIDLVPSTPSLFEVRNSVTIALPRMVPHTFNDGREGIEYQYAFQRDNVRIGGLGLFGTEDAVAGSAQPARIYPLDMTLAWVLEAVLGFKETLDNSDDDFAFLQSLAGGLVDVFVRHGRTRFSRRYIAITHADALVGAGIAVPDGVALLPDGTLVLAELFLPARAAYGEPS
jgi:hypothetical protein